MNGGVWCKWCRSFFALGRYHGAVLRAIRHVNWLDSKNADPGSAGYVSAMRKWRTTQYAYAQALKRESQLHERLDAAGLGAGYHYLCPKLSTEGLGACKTCDCRTVMWNRCLTPKNKGSGTGMRTSGEGIHQMKLGEEVLPPKDEGSPLP